MINRLGNYRQRFFTKFREDDMKTIADLQKELKDARGYLLGITIFSKDGKLYHSFISDNFPRVDILKSHNEVEKLLVKELKGETSIPGEGIHD